MDAGHIPKTFTRGFSELFTSQLDCSAIHLGRFEMRKCSHGEHGVAKFYRTRDDLDGLAVTPYQMHDLIDQIRVGGPCNHHINVLVHSMSPKLNIKRA